MNAQQEAVALYLHLEGRGFEPSVRSIGRALRDQGLRFREDDLRRWLKPYLDQTRDASGTQASASGRTGTQKTSTGDAVGRTDLRPDATRTRLRAHPKVPLVSDSSLSHTAREAAKDFAAWFCREGIAAGAIAAHHLDARLWAKNTGSVPYAEQLLAVHPRDEAERRALAVFALKLAGKLPQAITVKDLAKQWDSDDVAGTARPQGGVSDSARARAEAYRREHAT